MDDEARERSERASETRGDERPRLKQIDHEAPDKTSADGVFDRGRAERDERREAAANDPEAGE